MFVREILSKQGYLTILSIELLFSFYITKDLHLTFLFSFFLYMENFKKEEAVIDTHVIREMTRRRKGEK